MRNVEDKLIVLIVVATVLIVGGMFVAIGVWSWPNAADKRACRRAGGTVIEIGDHAEWHCVGATPEAK